MQNLAFSEFSFKQKNGFRNKAQIFFEMLSHFRTIPRHIALFNSFLILSN